MTTSDQSSFTRAEPMGDGALERVRDRYTEQPVPPCSVCGRDLRVQRAGGGAATVWGCDGHEADPNDPGKLRQSPTWDAGNNHYERSLWTQYRPGDPEVLALLSAAEERDALKAEVERLTDELKTERQILDMFPAVTAERYRTLVAEEGEDGSAKSDALASLTKEGGE